MKILVVRFSSIGDIVQTTSPLGTLRNHFPAAEINFLTLYHFRSLLADHPAVTRVLTIDQKAGVQALMALARKLNRRRYDLIVDLHQSLRSKILLLFIRSRTVAIKKPRWQRFLYMILHKNTFPEDYSYQMLLHKPLRTVTAVSHYPSPSLHLNDTQTAWQGWGEKYHLPDHFIALVPGAAWKNKQWPVAYYHVLIQDLIQAGNTVIILGGEGDRICFAIDLDHDRVINLAGKTSLRDSLIFVERADLVIGSDTGLVHAAEALGTPVIAILGPTTREMGAGVHLETSTQLEDKTVWCRPCSQNGSRPCYRTKRFCMENITPEYVSHAISGYLTK